MKDTVPNHRGNHGDGEIRDRKDVADGGGQRLPLSIGPIELSHQEIRIKEKNDKRDLGQGATDAV
jgi:hypothetical protein